jgi:hypothetical protein
LNTIVCYDHDNSEVASLLKPKHSSDTWGKHYLYTGEFIFVIDHFLHIYRKDLNRFSFIQLIEIQPTSICCYLNQILFVATEDSLLVYREMNDKFNQTETLIYPDITDMIVSQKESKPVNLQFTSENKEYYFISVC